jgi:hypothetical protein
MFDITKMEPTAPNWRELADMHGITANLIEETGKWTAWVEWFGEAEMTCGDTEKEAVVSLLHRLKLTGWETVSI